MYGMRTNKTQTALYNSLPSAAPVKVQELQTGVKLTKNQKKKLKKKMKKANAVSYEKMMKMPNIVFPLSKRLHILYL